MADGNTITTTVSLTTSSPYSVSDDTMTFTDNEGEEQVLDEKISRHPHRTPNGARSTPYDDGRGGQPGPRDPGGALQCHGWTELGER